MNTAFREESSAGCFRKSMELLVAADVYVTRNLSAIISLFKIEYNFFIKKKLKSLFILSIGIIIKTILVTYQLSLR